MKFQKFVTGPKKEGGTYLKFTDGQSITAVLRGDIHTSYVKWTDGKAERVVEGTPGAKPRFSVNAVVAEGGRLVARTWEFGMLVHEALSEINQEYALDRTKIKITRKGMGLDTEYKIIPLLKDEDKLTSKQMKELEAVQLNILDGREPQRLPPSSQGEDDWGGFTA